MVVVPWAVPSSIWTQIMRRLRASRGFFYLQRRAEHARKPEVGSLDQEIFSVQNARSSSIPLYRRTHTELSIEQCTWNRQC